MVESYLWLQRGFLGSNPGNGAKYNTMVWSGTNCNTIARSGSECVSSLFINLFCTCAVLERSADREWHNLSSPSSDGRGYPFEQSCQGVGNTKTRRTLSQQLTIIYFSMFRLQTVSRERERERERESLRVCEQKQRECPLPNLTELFERKLPTDKWSTDNCWQLFKNQLILIYLNSGYQ